MTSDTFLDVLDWRPRMVAMHFVLEAGFFVEHYPGIQIASIGPRIVEPPPPASVWSYPPSMTSGAYLSNF